MAVKKLTQDALNRFMDTLIASNKVVGVQAKGEAFDYAPLAKAQDLRLDYDVTLQSPKSFVLPPCETLMTFAVGGAYKPVCDAEPTILVGVHPYDLVALNQMDALFSQDNVDSQYMQRRRSITIIACDVQTPSKHTFASSMGTAVVQAGFDILLTDIGNGILAEAATEKGTALLAQAGDATDANADDLSKRQAVWDKNKKNLNKHELK